MTVQEFQEYVRFINEDNNSKKEAINSISGSTSNSGEARMAGNSMPVIM